MSGGDPILLDFPESFETERLTIRCPRRGDGPLVNEAIVESLNELRPWMPWAKDTPSVEDTESNLRHAWVQFQKREDLRLLLLLKDGGTCVGSSGLHRIDWAARKFEIGYWIRTSYAGQGLMTEAVEAIAAFAAWELGANRIEIRCDTRNARSAKVAERLGFTLEGVLRNDSVGEGGTLRSTNVFSKIRGVEFT